MEGWYSLESCFGKYVRGTHKDLYPESIFAPRDQEVYVKRYWTELSLEGEIKRFITKEIYEPSGRVWEETYQKL